MTFCAASGGRLLDGGLRLVGIARRASVGSDLRHEPRAELGELGVAWRVVPDDLLMAEATHVATRLAALPTLSVRAMKRVLNHAAVPDIHRALQLETDATVAGFLDPETTRLLTDF